MISYRTNALSSTELEKFVKKKSFPNFCFQPFTDFSLLRTLQIKYVHNLVHSQVNDLNRSRAIHLNLIGISCTWRSQYWYTSSIVHKSHNTAGIKNCSSIVIFFQNFVQYWYTSNVIKILDCFILGGSCHQLLKNILKVQVHCVSFYWHL